MSFYEDMLVTDTERIQRAKQILRDPYVDRRNKREAVELLKLYERLSKEFSETGNKEQRERAAEIGYELRR